MVKVLTPEELAALGALMRQRAQERITGPQAQGVVKIDLQVEGMKEAVASLETVREKAAELSGELERMNKLFREAMDLARQVEESALQVRRNE